jgi:hypothetical protein
VFSTDDFRPMHLSSKGFEPTLDISPEKALLLTGLARNRKSLRKEEHLSRSSYATN